MRVVNDCAERAVKLTTDYIMALTHDEEQRQLIFQVVERHREPMAAPLKRKFTEVEDLTTTKDFSDCSVLPNNNYGGAMNIQFLF